MSKNSVIQYDFADEEAKKQFVMRLRELKDAGVRAITAGGLSRRWDEQEKAYKNIAEISRETGYAMLHWPLVQPICDRVASGIFSVLKSRRPYVQVEFLTRDETVEVGASGKVERIMDYWLAKDSMYENLLESATRRVTWQHRVGGRVFFTKAGDYGSYPCLHAELINSKNMSVHDALSGKTSEKAAVFHKFERLKYEFIMSAKKGLYDETAVKQLQVNNQYGHTATEDTDSTLQDDSRQNYAASASNNYQPVTGWEGLYYGSPNDEAKDFKLWIVTFSECGQLLRMMPFKYKRSWYFSGVIKRDDEWYWPSYGLATDLWALQQEINHVMNNALDSFAFECQNVWARENQPGSVGNTQEVIKIYPGMVMTDGQKYTPLITKQVSPAGITWGEDIWKRAMLVAQGMSQQRFGMELPGAETLGEAEIAQSEANIGEEPRIATFANTFCEELFEAMRWVLHEEWNEWFPYFGATLGLEDSDRDLLAKPMIISCAATSTSHTPRSRRRDLMEFVGIVGKMFPVFLEKAGYNAVKEMAATYDSVDGDNIIIPEERVDEVLTRIANQGQNPEGDPNAQPGPGESGSAPDPNTPSVLDQITGSTGSGAPSGNRPTPSE